MQTNVVPTIDLSINTTGCCPKFNPEGWDDQTLHFDNKLFLRAVTKSLHHVPIDMGQVFARVQERMEDIGAVEPSRAIVLSRELSESQAEHLFASDKDVPGEEMVRLNGTFITRVFEGPYSDEVEWRAQMAERASTLGSDHGRIFMFYTTCPTCAKAYGQNYVVGFAEI